MQFFVVPFGQFLQSKGIQSRFIEADEADDPSDPSLCPAMMHRVKGLEYPDDPTPLIKLFSLPGSKDVRSCMPG